MKTPNQSLKEKNELAKLKIQAEFGGKFQNNENLDPVIENIFLNNVLEFEEAMANSKQLPIHELLGKPVFKSVEDISDDEMKDELNSVMNLLNEKNIAIDSICGIDDREMYRFITKELILLETESVRPKNMTTYFIYEEFYPNHDYDLRQSANDFMTALTKKDSDYFNSFLTEGDDEVSKVKYTNMLRRLELFRNAFEEITLEEFKIVSLDVKDKSAEMIFEFRIFTLIPGSKKPHFISGRGNFLYEYKYDVMWCIREMGMEGVV